MIRFKCLASGSSGNCYYLGTEEEGILIDAGIPTRMITQNLKAMGIGWDTNHIQGVIVTHEHTDHIRAIGGLVKDYHLPIFATAPVHNGISRSRFIQEDITSSRREIRLKEDFRLAGFEITAFAVPHDSLQNVGYHIRRDDFSFVFITDIGHITPDIVHYASKAQHLVLEANYDPEMLEAGKYPQFLKERVSGRLGHLSNPEAAELLCQIYAPHLTNVWLCHISKDNNHPDLCWKHVEDRLFREGIRVGKDLSLTVLKRTTPSPTYLLGEAIP